jgi:hypothetical protein
VGRSWVAAATVDGDASGCSRGGEGGCPPGMTMGWSL